MLKGSELFTNTKLKEIHDIVYKKPYDINPCDWIEAWIQKDISPQKTSRYFCSALVGYIYTKCGLLNKKTDWSILRPVDFAITSNDLQLNENIKLSDKEIRIK